MKQWLLKSIATGLVLLLLLMVGCDAAGYSLWLLTPRKTEKVKAEYEGLAEHTVAILIYSSQDIQYEFPNVRLTLATRIRGEMERQIKDVRVIDPLAVARYQDENLHWDSRSKRTIGEDLKADYVLFITLIDYRMTLPGTIDAYQAQISAEAHLYRTAAEDDEPIWETDEAIEIIFPKKGPRYSAGSLPFVQAGAEREFAQTIVRFFYDHEVEMYPEDE
jgi:hypothetical protein